MKNPKLKKSLFSLLGAALLAVTSLFVFSCADDFDEGTTASISIVLPGTGSAVSGSGRSIISTLLPYETEDLKGATVLYKVTVTGESGFSVYEEVTISEENPEPKPLVIADIPFGKCTVNVQAVANIQEGTALRKCTVASGSTTVTLADSSTVNVPVKLYTFTQSNIVDIDVDWGSVKDSYLTTEIDDGVLSNDMTTVSVTAIMKDGSRIALDDEDSAAGIYNVRNDSDPNRKKYQVTVTVYNPSDDEPDSEIALHKRYEIEVPPVSSWEGLSQAITEASNGDTIKIQGSLDANTSITITKSLTIKAKAGTTISVISDSESPFLIQDSTNTIDVTFEGESDNADDFVIKATTSANQHLLNVSTAKSFTVKNATLRGVNGTSASAICCQKENIEVTLENVTVTENTGNSAVVAYFINATSCRFINNTNSNTSYTGGALRCIKGTLTDCEFTGNSATSTGGAINKTANNTSQTLTIKGGKFDGNYLTAGKNGAGIGISDGTVILDGVEFGRNYIISNGEEQTATIPDYDIWCQPPGRSISAITLKGKMKGLDSLILKISPQDSSNPKISFSASDDGTPFQIVTSSGTPGKVSFGINSISTLTSPIAIFQDATAENLSYFEVPESAETRNTWTGFSDPLFIKSNGSITNVDPDAPVTTWAGLSSAISEASDGDTIKIQGSLEANSQISVTKSLTIKAKAGTTIKPTTTDCLFRCNNYNINFVIEGESENAGDFVIDNPDNLGGTWIFFMHSNLTVKNATLQKLSGGGTSAIKLSDESAELILENVTLKDNAGEHPVYATKITASNCRFLNNKNAETNGTGGAIFCNEGTLTDCEFAGNSAKLGGGAIHKAESGTLTINRGKFDGNYLTNGKKGAGIFVANGIVVLDSVEFGRNYIISNDEEQSASIPDYDIYSYHGNSLSLKGKTSLDTILIDIGSIPADAQPMIECGASELNGSPFKIVTSSGAAGKLNLGIISSLNINDLPFFQNPTSTNLSYFQSPESAETRETWTGSTAPLYINSDGTISNVAAITTWSALKTAITNASDGDEFLIAGDLEGTSQIWIQKSLTIKAKAGTTITAAVAGLDLFLIEDTSRVIEVTIEGVSEDASKFVITDSRSTTASRNLLSVSKAKSLTVKNATLKNVSGSSYAAINSQNMSQNVILNNVTVTGNTSQSAVIAFVIDATNCRFTENISSSTDAGGALYCRKGTLTNCEFTGNSSAACGGAIYRTVQNGDESLTIKGGKFDGNYLTSGKKGAGIYIEGGSVIFDSVEFGNNFVSPQNTSIPDYDIYCKADLMIAPEISLKGKITGLDSLILAVSQDAQNPKISFGASDDGTSFQIVTSSGTPGKVNFGLDSTSTLTSPIAIFQNATAENLSYFEVPGDEIRQTWTGSSSPLSIKDDGTISNEAPPATFTDWAALKTAVEAVTNDATFYIQGNMTATESLQVNNNYHIKIIAKGETTVTSNLTDAALFALNNGSFTLEGAEGSNFVIDGNEVENTYALLHSITSGNIVLKNVDIIKTNGTATTLDASVAYISSEATSVEFENVKLKDCKGKLAAIVSASNTTFTNCTFENCSNLGGSSDGGAVKLDNAGSFTSCTFTGNNTQGDGGAVCIAGSGTDTVEKDVIFNDCTFKNNYSDGKSGGAVAVERAYTHAIFNGGEFSENYLSGDSSVLQGGAIFVYSGWLTLDSVNINNNYRLKSDGQKVSCDTYVYTSSSRQPTLNLKGNITNLSSLILDLSETSTKNVKINLGNSQIEGKTAQGFAILKNGSESTVKIGVSGSAKTPTGGAKIFETFTQSQIDTYFELPSADEMKTWTGNTRTPVLDSSTGTLTLN